MKNQAISFVIFLTTLGALALAVHNKCSPFILVAAGTATIAAFVQALFFWKGVLYTEDGEVVADPRSRLGRMYPLLSLSGTVTGACTASFRLWVVLLFAAAYLAMMSAVFIHVADMRWTEIAIACVQGSVVFAVMVVIYRCTSFIKSDWLEKTAFFIACYGLILWWLRKGIDWNDVIVPSIFVFVLAVLFFLSKRWDKKKVTKSGGVCPRFFVLPDRRE